MRRHYALYGILVLIGLSLILWSPFGYSETKFVVTWRPVNGLGDRFRGFILSFYVALLTNRHYIIAGEQLFGERFEECIQPAKYDWTLNNAIWNGLDPYHFVHRQMDGYTVNFTTLDLNWYRHFRTWEMHTNYIRLDEMLEHPELKKHPFFPLVDGLAKQGRLWHYALQTLFQPGHLVEEVINKIFEEKNITSKTFKVGMHLRVGDHHGMDFDEPNPFENENQPNAAATGKRQKRAWNRLVPLSAATCFAVRALKFWEDLDPTERAKYAGQPVFFVSSESSDAIEEVKRFLHSKGYLAFDVEKESGRVKHIANTKGSQLRQFVDWWLMTKMDRLVISLSGFSETAAKYSCAQSCVYYQNPCRFYELGPNGYCNTIADQWNLYEVIGDLVAKT